GRCGPAGLGNIGWIAAQPAASASASDRARVRTQAEVGVEVPIEVEVRVGSRLVLRASVRSSAFIADKRTSMKLQRLRIDQLRQFRQPLEIEEFNSGINVFVGPNESGKSTVVRAIRAAFFERHRSSTVADLQP